MNDVVSPRGSRRQLLILGGVFLLICSLLGLGYFLFLRTSYVVLAEGLRPADAQAVVAELDKKHASYQLRDGGRTILVPEGSADATRLAIAGSDAAERGQIGFELFNKSDMGLTNFAQKINYQRALQGELVRTIVQMDGVESARVHLALPERSLFRGEREDPTAAVTIAMKPGQQADPARVEGIQRLVAAAVPDLPQSKVVVLDSAGRVISPVVAAEPALDRPADLDERSAVENYYRARARGAVERQLPGLHFAVRVLLMPIAAPSSAASGEAADNGWVPSGDGPSRNFRLRMQFETEVPLGGDDQAVVREAITAATPLSAALGDSLEFQTGPVDPIAAPGPAPVQRSATPATAAAQPAPLAVPRFDWFAWLGWGSLILVAVALLVWLLRRRGMLVLEARDHEAFAAKLRRQLNLEDGGDAVA
ncbi:flagellar basal-body MS-ring/collar protein FliF [Sphingomonas sp.]|uniref:flagellar basal-body MS-ring/collar protein FliF n=1 Tax=Sphingomonas sp. TaxID=28214 RepID=UPI001B2B3152|nr:flagellar basal-body MS-ring/collar protein FliF [Sphingomonas sp.]MBO9714797.1 flagellar M-ring protein FliF [Sphingomonas sp.]